MRLVPAPFALAVALALAACALDDAPTDDDMAATPAANATPATPVGPTATGTTPAAPSQGATPSAADDTGTAATPGTPSIARTRGVGLDAPAATPTATAPAPPDDAAPAPPAAPSLLERMFGSITAHAGPAPADTGPPTAEPAAPAARGAPADAPDQAGVAPYPAPESPPPTETRGQSAALAAPVAPPTPHRAPRPDAALCADVTAGGSAKEVDLERVRQALDGGDYRRGSFETNAAYRSRIATKLEAVTALTVAATGRADLVFSLPIPDYRLTYDDEARELWIGSDLGLLRSGSAIGMGDFIVVSVAERQIGRHLSTISYGMRRGAGVEREVARVVGNQLGLIVPGGSSLGWPANFQRLGVPMTPVEANAAKGAIAVLFVAHLQEPYFLTGRYVQEAKPDDPVEKRLDVAALKIAIDCAALYDRKSGRLLKTLVPAGG